jgi:putative ABC transport system substrate-binding protein
MAIHIQRRRFITLLGGAAAWPLAARGQQSAMPVVGFLNLLSPDTYTDRLRAFRQGLRDAGYVEGQNMAIDYRWAENQLDRLPELAVELARRPVAVIVTSGGTVSALAAKAATSTIPIVFFCDEDPVRLGLVSSLARPSGNLTGINLLIGELAGKRLGLLHELVPKAVRLAVLLNPVEAASAAATMRDLETAASGTGLQIRALNASTYQEIDAAFAGFVHERPDALFVATQPLFTSRRVQLALLAAHYSIPAIYGVREITEVGGLMSYGINLADAWRQIGVYTGRILKGAKPADLPVVQSSKFELVINLQTARLLGLNPMPPTLLARVDEVIE